MDVDQSFAEFVTARWSMLYRLAVLVAGPDAADDVAQAALARAYASWHEVEESASADAHVKGLVAREAAALPERDRPTASPAHLGDTHDTGDTRDVGWRLAALPARQRAAVVLRSYELLTDGEIARAIGGKPEAAQAEVARALSALAVPSDELGQDLAMLAAETEVPLPPLDAVLALGHAVRHRRRWRTLRWSAGVAAVVVLGLASASILQATTSDGPGDRPSPRPVPASLARLPEGPTPSVAYAEGNALHVGPAFTIRFPDPPSSVAQAGGRVYVALTSGRIYRIDPGSGAHQLAAASGGMVTTDATGRFAAWGPSGLGEAIVVIESSPVGDGPGRRQHVFPAQPHCCDNPFLVKGVTVAGEVVASMPADNRAWVWRSQVPGQPGAADDVEEIGGLGNGVVHQVLANELVVLYPPSHFAVGVLDGDAFLVSEDVVGRNADFGDPSGERVVYATYDGEILVRDRHAGDAPEDLRLLLPALADGFASARWEDARHVLLDVADASMPDGALVRCDVEDGECAIAVVFDERHLLAR